MTRWLTRIGWGSNQMRKACPASIRKLGRPTCRPAWGESSAPKLVETPGIFRSDARNQGDRTRTFGQGAALHQCHLRPASKFRRAGPHDVGDASSVRPSKLCFRLASHRGSNGTWFHDSTDTPRDRFPWPQRSALLDCSRREKMQKRRRGWILCASSLGLSRRDPSNRES